jgi:phosphoribosyl 1,2-cyclic phosphodiesterase
MSENGGQSEEVMSLRVCVLASGSKGNCTYVGSRNTSILIDAGLSGRETALRLAAVDRTLADISAVCVSHEHGDHTSGLKTLNSRHGIPLYANTGTIEGVRRNARLQDLKWQVFTTGSGFTIGDLTIAPFSVPHDAYDPVGFTIHCEGVTAGVVTDMGVPTSLIRQHLKTCRVVVVEANHDEQMLQEAQRPWSLKQRIRGRQGHLSNESAADMLAEIAGPDLHHVFLAHISDDCNRHDLAVGTARRRLAERGCPHVKVTATFPDRVSELWAAETL